MTENPEELARNVCMCVLAQDGLHIYWLQKSVGAAGLTGMPICELAASSDRLLFLISIVRN